jgi:hypothetical protein
MSRSLGGALPAGLGRLLSQVDLGALRGRGLPFVTLSADGSLHPMLTSYLEWLAVDERTLRLVVAGASRSARNLTERSVGTLLVVEPERTIYVKCRAAGTPLRVADLARFTLLVEDVLEDAPDEAEGDVRITSGIRYGPAPEIDDARVRAVLVALRMG